MPFHDISIVTFPFLQASRIIGYSLSTNGFELITFPVTLFYPSNIHPSESFAVFPACINTPLNELTFNSLGVYLLNLGE